MAKDLRPSDVKTQHPLRMDRGLAIDLYAFCATQIGSKKNPVICEAIRSFIATELERNPLVSERFHQVKTKLVEPQVTEIRLVPSKAVSGA